MANTFVCIYQAAILYFTNVNQIISRIKSLRIDCAHKESQLKGELGKKKSTEGSFRPYKLVSDVLVYFQKFIWPKTAI